MRIHRGCSVARWAFRGLACLLASGLCAATPGAAPGGESSAQRDERMRWWREARFGLFVHWGIYSVPAGMWQGQPVPGIGEWIQHRAKIPVAEYAKFAREFNPRRFDADAWVRLAKQAGMKYIVVTAKHHDGFALFDSKASSFNIVAATPYGRDVLKDIAEACRRHGLKLGLYYSQAQDWHHPGGAAMGGQWDPAQAGDMTEYIKTVAVPQVREILSNYGPIAVLWWDTPTDMTRERADLLAPLLGLQPGIITNNRLGGGYEGDTETPENRVPATGYPRDWEACMTMNDTWGFKADDRKWKSAETLIRNLVDIASKGGNYLLNVGPTAEGEIPAASVERLEKIGSWMQKHGEAIYGTTASPFLRLSWGRVTQKPDRLYLHVFDWPADGHLIVPMRNGAQRARLLGTTGNLELDRTPAGLRIRVPAQAPDRICSVVVVDGVGPVDALPPPPLRAGVNGDFRLQCDSADLIGDSLRVEGYTVLNLGSWRRVDAYPVWAVHFDGPGTYEVNVTLSVPAGEGGEYFVEAAGVKLPARTTETGSQYRSVKLGTIDIPSGGATTVALKAVRIERNELMRLREIVLKRVPKS